MDKKKKESKIDISKYYRVPPSINDCGDLPYFITAATDEYVVYCKFKWDERNSKSELKVFPVSRTINERLTKKPIWTRNENKSEILAISPIGPGIFILSKNSQEFSYLQIRDNFTVKILHSTKMPNGIGFQGDMPSLVSSYEHFFSPEPQVTLCYEDDDNQIRVLNAELGKEIYFFEDMRKAFMIYENYFIGVNFEENICTFDLRVKYRNWKSSRIGYNSKFSSNSLVMNPDKSCYQFLGEECNLLPRGVHSVPEAEPHRGRSDRYYAKIYGAHYFLNPGNAYGGGSGLFQFFPNSGKGNTFQKKPKKKWIGPVHVDMFGGNKYMIFGMDMRNIQRVL